MFVVENYLLIPTLGGAIKAYSGMGGK